MHLGRDRRTCGFLGKEGRGRSCGEENRQHITGLPNTHSTHEPTQTNLSRPAISDGWWSESKRDRNRKATSICPRWGRTAWMSRIEGGEKKKVCASLISEWTTEGSGPSTVLTEPTKVLEVLTHQAELNTPIQRQIFLYIHDWLCCRCWHTNCWRSTLRSVIQDPRPTLKGPGLVTMESVHSGLI